VDSVTSAQHRGHVVGHSGSGRPRAYLLKSVSWQAEREVPCLLIDSLHHRLLIPLVRIVWYCLCTVGRSAANVRVHVCRGAANSSPRICSPCCSSCLEPRFDLRQPPSKACTQGSPTAAARTWPLRACNSQLIVTRTQFFCCGDCQGCCRLQLQRPLHRQCRTSKWVHLVPWAQMCSIVHTFKCCGNAAVSACACSGCAHLTTTSHSSRPHSHL
jgi:hypothetical protein